MNGILVRKGCIRAWRSDGCHKPHELKTCYPRRGRSSQAVRLVQEPEITETPEEEVEKTSPHGEVVCAELAMLTPTAPMQFSGHYESTSAVKQFSFYSRKENDGERLNYRFGGDISWKFQSRRPRQAYRV